VDTSHAEDYDVTIEENLAKLAKVFEENMDVERLIDIAGVRE